MKRIVLAAATSVLLLFLVAAIPASAQDDGADQADAPAASPGMTGPTEAAVGGIIEYSITTPADASGFEASLEFNKEALDFGGIYSDTDGARLLQVTNQPGRVSIGAYRCQNESCDADLAGAVGAITVRFAVIAPGSHELRLARVHAIGNGATSELDSSSLTVTVAGEAADGTGDAATSDGIEGGWLVDTSVGEFSFGDSTGTFVGFRVGEELQGLGEIEAVGRTPGVSGTVTIEGTSAVAATIEADMAALTTDDSRRDNRVQGALDVDEFPTATFVLTSPIEFGEGAAAGDPVSTTASGDLTVHGVTQPVEFAVDAQLVEGTIVLVGSTEITFADFGVTVPSAPIVLSANDFGTIELQLFLAKT